MAEKSFSKIFLHAEIWIVSHSVTVVFKSNFKLKNVIFSFFDSLRRMLRTGCTWEGKSFNPRNDGQITNVYECLKGLAATGILHYLCTSKRTKSLY